MIKQSQHVEGFEGRLLKAIGDKDMSCNQVGHLIGIGQGRVSKWVNDGEMPSCYNLVKLAKLLEVSTDYLLGLEGE